MLAGAFMGYSRTVSTSAYSAGEEPVEVAVNGLQIQACCDLTEKTCVQLWRHLYKNVAGQA
jgi:hypothetical protein